MRIMYVLRQLSLFKREDDIVFLSLQLRHEMNLSSLDLEDSRQIYKCRVIFQTQFSESPSSFKDSSFLFRPLSVRESP